MNIDDSSASQLSTTGKLGVASAAERGAITLSPMTRRLIKAVLLAALTALLQALSEENDE